MLSVDGYEANSLKSEIRRFTVRGMRSTGTNLVEQILKRNTNLSFAETGWKHGFNFEGVFDRRLLVVIPFRHWNPWIRSMYRKPWHASDQMHTLAFSDFIRAPWDTFIGGSLPKPHPMKDVPFQSDRHPVCGRRFHNLIELRNVKTQFLLGFRERNLNVMFVRLEWLVGREQEFLQIIRDQFGVGLKDRYQGVSAILATNYRHMIDVRPPMPQSLSPTDVEFVRSQLDPELEAALGYDFDRVPASA